MGGVKQFAQVAKAIMLSGIRTMERISLLVKTDTEPQETFSLDFASSYDVSAPSPLLRPSRLRSG